jgi:ribonuclease T1
VVNTRIRLSPTKALAAVVLLALVATFLVGCAGPASAPSGSDQPQTVIDQAELGGSTAEPRATATRQDTPTPQPSRSGLPTIRYQDLPQQAQDTIQLIEQDGPFPFERDGITFQNREGLLPNEARGYYREYTVITPGSRDRGARRIVAGAEGELYYTDDHYDSFREVIR